MQSDADTLKPLLGELASKGVNIISDSTLGEFKGSAYKENFQRHQGDVEDLGDSVVTSKANQLQHC